MILTTRRLLELGPLMPHARRDGPNCEGTEVRLIFEVSGRPAPGWRPADLRALGALQL